MQNHNNVTWTKSHTIIHHSIILKIKLDHILKLPHSLNFFALGYHLAIYPYELIFACNSIFHPNHFFSKCNFDIPKCLLANPQSFLQPDPLFICWTFLSPQSHITSSNERKLLDHPTTNIFSWCCSPLTTHIPLLAIISIFLSLNISTSFH